MIYLSTYLGYALEAEPVPIWNDIHPGLEAVRVVSFVTTVTEQQLSFIVILGADLTCLEENEDRGYKHMFHEYRGIKA